MEVIIMAKSFDELVKRTTTKKTLARAASVVVPDVLADSVSQCQAGGDRKVSGQQRRDGQHDHRVLSLAPIPPFVLIPWANGRGSQVP